MMTAHAQPLLRFELSEPCDDGVIEVRASFGGRAAAYCRAMRVGESVVLEHLVVEPAFRGRGIGSAVLQHLKRTAATRKLQPVRCQLWGAEDFSVSQWLRRHGLSVSPVISVVHAVAEHRLAADDC